MSIVVRDPSIQYRAASVELERRPPVGNKPAGSQRFHGGAAWDILPPTKEPGVKKWGIQKTCA
jgi:hypothetical protein